MISFLWQSEPNHLGGVLQVLQVWAGWRSQGLAPGFIAFGSYARSLKPCDESAKCKQSYHCLGLERSFGQSLCLSLQNVACCSTNGLLFSSLVLWLSTFVSSCMAVPQVMCINKIFGSCMKKTCEHLISTYPMECHASPLAFSEVSSSLRLVSSEEKNMFSRLPQSSWRQKTQHTDHIRCWLLI